MQVSEINPGEGKKGNFISLRFICCHTKATFVANGPSFKSDGFVGETFANLDVYSLLCHIIGLTPAPNNGTLTGMQQFLKEKK
jgi:hypothetical protein